MTAEYVVARDIAAARKAKRALGPDAHFMAGGTALQLAWADGRLRHPVIDILGIDMGPSVVGPDVGVGDGRLRIAANARLEDVRIDPRIRSHAPCIGACLGEIASLGVRHLATFGGNVGWRAGDLVPLLLVLGASAHFADDSVEPLAAGLGRVADELLVAVEIPLPLPQAVFCEKIGRRAAFTPSVITVAGARGTAGPGREPGLRLAVGGGPVEPAVLDRNPGLLLEASGDFDAIATAIAGCIAAPDDDVASGGYRREAAGRVLADFVLSSRALDRGGRGGDVSA